MPTSDYKRSKAFVAFIDSVLDRGACVRPEDFPELVFTLADPARATTFACGVFIRFLQCTRKHGDRVPLVEVLDDVPTEGNVDEHFEMLRTAISYNAMAVSEHDPALGALLRTFVVAVCWTPVRRADPLLAGCARLLEDLVPPSAAANLQHARAVVRAALSPAADAQLLLARFLEAARELDKDDLPWLAPALPETVGKGGEFSALPDPPPVGGRDAGVLATLLPRLSMVAPARLIGLSPLSSARHLSCATGVALMRMLTPRNAPRTARLLLPPILATLSEPHSLPRSEFVALTALLTYLIPRFEDDALPGVPKDLAELAVRALAPATTLPDPAGSRALALRGAFAMEATTRGVSYVLAALSQCGTELFAQRAAAFTPTVCVLIVEAGAVGAVELAAAMSLPFPLGVHARPDCAAVREKLVRAFIPERCWLQVGLGREHALGTFGTGHPDVAKALEAVCRLLCSPERADRHVFEEACRSFTQTINEAVRSSEGADDAQARDAPALLHSRRATAQSPSEALSLLPFRVISFMPPVDPQTPFFPSSSFANGDLIAALSDALAPLHRERAGERFPGFPQGRAALFLAGSDRLFTHVFGAVEALRARGTLPPFSAAHIGLVPVPLRVPDSAHDAAGFMAYTDALYRQLIAPLGAAGNALTIPSLSPVCDELRTRLASNTSSAAPTGDAELSFAPFLTETTLTEPSLGVPALVHQTLAFWAQAALTTLPLERVWLSGTHPDGAASRRVFIASCARLLAPPECDDRVGTDSYRLALTLTDGSTRQLAGVPAATDVSVRLLPQTRESGSHVRHQLGAFDTSSGSFAVLTRAGAAQQETLTRAVRLAAEAEENGAFLVDVDGTLVGPFAHCVLELDPARAIAWELLRA